MLYDAFGRKVETRVLTEEVAAPTLTGIRNVWGEAVASGLTPLRLAQLLRSAAEGEIRDYLTLAEEMEERELHYRSVLGTRKLAVSGLEVTVEPASEDADDKRLPDEVAGLVRDPGFKPMLKDLTDALGKGFSVVELLWDRGGSQWMPRYAWRDPRFFRFDQVSGSELRLLDEAGAIDGVPLPPYKFIAHVHKLKSGMPIRGGLAFVAAWTYCFSNFTLKDWMAFLEVFGMPVRIGKYGPSATKDQIQTLLRALANLGSDAAAAIPQSMLIEFPETKRESSIDAFERMAKHLEQLQSKVVLGQTMTTDDGSSRAQAEVHDRVRIDLLDDDADQHAATLNRDLVRPFVDLNFGPPKSGAYPRMLLPVPRPEDLKQLSEALAKLVPLGLEVDQQEVRAKFGLREPAKEAKLLGAPKPPAPELTPQSQQGGGGDPALNRALALALNRMIDFSDNAVLEDVADEMLGGWQPKMAEAVEPIRRALDEATSFEDALERLSRLNLQPEQLTEALARAAFVARAAGAAGA